MGGVTAAHLETGATPSEVEALTTQFKLPEGEGTEWNRQLLWKGMIDVALRLTITDFDPARPASS